MHKHEPCDLNCVEHKVKFYAYAGDQRCEKFTLSVEVWEVEPTLGSGMLLTKFRMFWIFWSEILMCIRGSSPEILNLKNKLRFDATITGRGTHPQVSTGPTWASWHPSLPYICPAVQWSPLDGGCAVLMTSVTELTSSSHLQFIWCWLSDLAMKKKSLRQLWLFNVCS